MSVSRLRGRIEELSLREKVLLVVMLGVLCASVLMVSIVFMVKKINDLETQIEQGKSILMQLKENEETIVTKLEMKKDFERRFESSPPQLSGLLEELGRQSGVEIPETRDLQDEMIDKKWIQKSVEIKLRKVGLEALVAFMVRIKNQNRSFPIAITKLNIRKRIGEINSYDIQMTVSTYSLKEKKKQEKENKKGIHKGEEDKGERESEKTIKYNAFEST